MGRRGARVVRDERRRRADPGRPVARMRRANDFGKGCLARTQMFYAALSYRLHLENPDDLVARTRELQERYSPFPCIEGTCTPASFGHLDGYGSGYSTYMWSLVIAQGPVQRLRPHRPARPRGGPAPPRPRPRPGRVEGRRRTRA